MIILVALSGRGQVIPVLSPQGLLGLHLPQGRQLKAIICLALNLVVGGGPSWSGTPHFAVSVQPCLCVSVHLCVLSVGTCVWRLEAICLPPLLSTFSLESGSLTERGA